MVLHVGLNVDLGRSGPQYNYAVNTGLLLEVADVLANLLGHVPAVLALLHVVAVQALGVVLVKSSLHRLDLQQFVLNGLNVLLLQYLGVDGALIGIGGEDVPSGKHEVVQAGHRHDFIIV